MSRAVPILKWHQLRRRKSDPVFQRDNLAAALAAGAACEVDVVLTADGHGVCLHDLDLDRETTGTGPVAAASRAMIEGLRQRGPDGRVLPSPPLFLDEVVAAVAAIPAPPPARVQLDIKVPRQALDAAALAGFGRLLGPHAPAFVAGGCDWDAIVALAAAAPGLATGFDPLDLYERTDLPADAAAFRALGEATFAIAPTAAIFYLEARLVVAGLDHGVNLIERVARAGAMVDVWTLDADRPGLRSILERVIAAGCHQITSNDPEYLRPIIEEIAACS